MNTLIAVGTGAAFLYSVVATFAPQLFIRNGLAPDRVLRGRRPSSSRSFSRAMPSRREPSGRPHRRSGRWANLQPKTARRVARGTNGSEQEVDVPISEVSGRRGWCSCRPGERLPVDGTVVTGGERPRRVDADGESRFRWRSARGPIASSAERSTAPGALPLSRHHPRRRTARWSQMVKLMRRCPGLAAAADPGDSPIASSGIFVPVVISISILTFVVWFRDRRRGRHDGLVGRARLCGSGSRCSSSPAPARWGWPWPTAVMVATGKGAGARHPHQRW